MSHNYQELKDRISHLTDQELVRLVTEDFLQYKKETFEIALEELQKRKLLVPQEKLELAEVHLRSFDSRTNLIPKDDLLPVHKILGCLGVIGIVTFFVVGYIATGGSDMPIPGWTFIIIAVSFALLLPGILHIILPQIKAKYSTLNIFIGRAIQFIGGICLALTIGYWWTEDRSILRKLDTWDAALRNILPYIIMVVFSCFLIQLGVMVVKYSKKNLSTKK